MNDFDFGSGDVIKPKASKEENFDFNFKKDDPKPEAKPAEGGGGGDLMDLLGGIDMSAGA